MSWIDQAKAQLETHAHTLDAVLAISKIVKQALVDPDSDIYVALQVLDKIADALIAGFSGKGSSDEIRKQLAAALEKEPSINERVDRALAEKFGKEP